MIHGLGIRTWRERWLSHWRRYHTDPGGGEGEGAGGDGGTASGGDGGDDDWRASLPEDLRDDQSLKVFKDVGALAKGFVETKKLVGQQSLAVPGEGATEGEWNSFYKALGRPDAPEGYGLEMPAEEKVPKGVYVSEGLHQGFVSLAHKVGLMPGQARVLQEGFMGLLGEEAATLEATDNAAFEKAETALKDEWVNDFEKNRELARRAAATVFGTDGMEELVKYGFDNNPLFIKKMFTLAQGMDEERLAASAGGAGGEMSSQEAQKRIDEIKADAKGPYWATKASREHREALAEVNELEARIAKARRESRG